MALRPLPPTPKENRLSGLVTNAIATFAVPELANGASGYALGGGQRLGPVPHRALHGPGVSAPESQSAPARAGCSGSPSRQGLIGPELKHNLNPLGPSWNKSIAPVTFKSIPRTNACNRITRTGSRSVPAVHQHLQEIQDVIFQNHQHPRSRRMSRSIRKLSQQILGVLQSKTHRHPSTPLRG